MEIEELFCKIDDFCLAFEESFKSKLIAHKTTQRVRKSQLCLSEVMTIVINFHRSSYRNFKAYYQHLLQFYQKEFPLLVSYNRFIELIPQALMPLLLYLNYHDIDVTGINFIDSTPIPICHPKRAKRNKVFSGLAAWGKSSMGWFFGFKLHLIINECGQIIAFKLTPGNVDDRVPVPDLTQDIWGYLFGDKGYIKQELWAELWEKQIKLITPLKKNMRNKLMLPWEKLMLRKRSLIETVNDQLKNISQIVNSRHRSIINFLVNVVAGLIAYSLQPKKPSLNVKKDGLTQLPQLLV